MSIEWNRVTPLSQAVAIVLFVAVFALAFWLGRLYELKHPNGPASATQTPATSLGEKPISDVTFACKDDKTVHAIFRKQEVELLLSDGRHLTVPQAVSGSGARYASADESFVFWTKGDTAFVTEGKDTTYADCALMPILE